MLRGLKYGPEVDWWALGIVMYQMMVGENPFKSPKELSYHAKIVHFTLVYPWSLTGDAKSILEGVSIFNTKTEAFRSALQFLEFNVFPHLVTLYSHRVNIKKMCVSGLREDYVCFEFCLFYFRFVFWDTCYHISTCLKAILTLKFQNLLGPPTGIALL